MFEAGGVAAASGAGRCALPTTASRCRQRLAVVRDLTPRSGPSTCAGAWRP